jgi:hypothetical protein
MNEPMLTPELRAAIDNFRFLFVADTDPPALSLDVNPDDLANAYDELSKAMATATASSLLAE